MSILESSFEILIRKMAELMEELRLTHDQLATRTQDPERQRNGVYQGGISEKHPDDKN
jgi:hypothetical protein